jgi:excisionase family DNA binding protein
MMERTEPWVLTPREAMKILRCSRGVFYQGVRRGTIPALRISQRKILVPKRRFFAWLNGAANLNENDVRP